MRIISARNVVDLLPMSDAIDVVRSAMIDVSDGKTNLPLRNIVDVGAPNMMGIMPGVLNESRDYGVKVLSLFPGNPAKGLSSHIGAVLMFDPASGAPTALINADAITAIRTAAATAAATDALARPDSSVLAIVGTGEQAETHIRALSLVRPISEVRIAGPTPDKAAQFVETHAADFPDLTLVAARDAEAAVQGADIVCTVTSSAKVVLRGDWIGAGTHVNAVGASIPVLQEIDEAMVLKSRLFVDYRPSALAQAKEIIDAMAAGTLKDSDILAEIGEIYAGRAEGRTDPDQITLYRSLGVAAQDLSCGAHVLKQAIAGQVGTEADIL